MKKSTQRIIETVGIAGALFLPFTAFATDTLARVLCTMGSLVAGATPIVAGLALLAFFWGLAMYVFSLSGNGGTQAHSAYGMPASPEGKKQGRSVMLYGIIVLFIMVSVWGLVKLLQVTFNINDGATLTPPTIGGIPPATISSLSCS